MKEESNTAQHSIIPSQKLSEEGKPEETIHHCVASIIKSIEGEDSDGELAKAYFLTASAEYALKRPEKSVVSLSKCL